MTVTPDARTWLAEKGYDAQMGARPMARVIQENIKRPLADEILFGRLSVGGHVIVQVRSGGLVLEFETEPASVV